MEKCVHVKLCRTLWNSLEKVLKQSANVNAVVFLFFFNTYKQSFPAKQVDKEE